jgi:hypothetical protein
VSSTPSIAATGDPDAEGVLLETDLDDVDDRDELDDVIEERIRRAVENARTVGEQVDDRTRTATVADARRHARGE